METTSNISPPKQEHVKKCISLWIAALVVVILLVIIGYLLWLVVNLMAQNATLNEAQSKLNSRTKSSVITPAVCSDTPTTALKDSIRTAVTNHNYVSLGGHMADSVNVVIAASEKGGAVAKAVAVADMEYLTAATTPWNFSLSTATIDGWRAHFYTTYFSATSYAGEAASHQVVSFDFDCSGKIDQVFMSVSSDLLND